MNLVEQIRTSMDCVSDLKTSTRIQVYGIAIIVTIIAEFSTVPALALFALFIVDILTSQSGDMSKNKSDCIIVFCTMCVTNSIIDIIFINMGLL